MDSIFIVVNAAGEVANETNAIDCRKLTINRVATGVDIVAPDRFSEAIKKLTKNTRILMHQGGSIKYRPKYGSGQIIAAGRILETPRELTASGIQKYNSLYQLTKGCYPNKTLVGIVFYLFQKGLTNHPLAREIANYRPNRGNNYIEIKPDDIRYTLLDNWWKDNF